MTRGLIGKDLDVMSDMGVNWVSMSEMTNAGINWLDMDVLSDAGDQLGKM